MGDSHVDSNRDENRSANGGAKVGKRLESVLADLAALNSRLQVVDAHLERAREAERAVGARS